MRVLIVSGIFPPDRGGPASYVPAMGRALALLGHRVEVICLSDSVDVANASYPFPVHRIPRGRLWPVRIIHTLVAIWRGARRHDVVFVNGLGAEAALAALAARRPAVHKIVGDYAWERAVGRGWFKGSIDTYQTSRKSLTLRLTDLVRTVPLTLAARIIVPSRYLKRIVAGWGLPEDRIRVVYNAVPAPITSIVGLPPWHGHTLVTVCRLVPWKGVDGLIDLLRDLPDTRLVIAGSGHLQGDLEAMAARAGVGAQVVFLGDVPHRDVAGYLKHADAFVLNSTYEGLPHVVLEAMAVGVPVIATRAGGTPEVVEDEVTGLLVDVGDRAALLAAIERLWRSDALAASLTGHATQRLTERFDAQRMIADTQAILAAEAAPRVSAPRVMSQELP